MDTIIDGYNLIFGLGWQGSSQHSLALEKARQRLIRELAARIPADQRGAVTIVFDAKTSPLQTDGDQVIEQGFRVLFARDYDEADTLIEALIRGHAVPKSLTVVSNDNRLKTAARRRKAIAIDGDVWLDQIGLAQIKLAQEDEETPAKESTKEQAIRELSETDWLAEFEIPEEAAQESKATTPLEAPKYNPFPPGYGEDLLK